MNKKRLTTQERIGIIAEKLKEKRILRFIEVHNAIGGLIVDNTKVGVAEGDKKKNLEFDGFWESSLTDSASKGLPDAEIVSIDSRLNTINQIMEVTKKPMIVDGDTGGDLNQFEYLVKRLERAGVSMVVIEDKVFPKRNSLEPGTIQELEIPEIFAEKIRRGRSARRNKNFLIVARIESLIAGLSIRDALERAEIYLRTGADGILIHSKKETADEILEFAENFKKLPFNLIKNKFLVCIPTTYNTITEEKLEKAGFNIVIYANHMLRASYLAMEKTCKDILIHSRAFEVEPYCAPIQTIFAEVGFLKIKEMDKIIAQKFGSKVKVIIPAAGKDALSEKYQRPRALIEINGKTILERQMEVLKKVGLNNIVVIKGYRGELFKRENIKYYTDKNYEKKYIVNSLFCAEEMINSPFILIYSDILFNENIIRNLLKVGEKNKNADVILVVDNSFQFNKDKLKDRRLDLVITKNKEEDLVRKVVDDIEEEASVIGTKINKDTADYEFIGMAYFSEKGVQVLKDIYHESLEKYPNKFHEAENIYKANLTDLLQEIIDRGYKVKVFKTYKGWMEIEEENDVRLAEEFYKKSEL